MLDLIDACVTECYVRERIAERDLLVHDTVAPHLAAYTPRPAPPSSADFVSLLRHTLHAPGHPIHDRRRRLTADSLAVIKQEGKI